MERHVHICFLFLKLPHPGSHTRVIWLTINKGWQQRPVLIKRELAVYKFNTVIMFGLESTMVG